MKRIWNVSGLLAMSLLGSALPALPAIPIARDRLVRVAAGSRDLAGKSEALPEQDAKMLAMAAVVPEDRKKETAKRYARASEVAAYVKLRPWSAAYRYPSSRVWPAVTVETWPARADASALRKLLGNPDGEVRSLAVEALGSLALPEDVPRIAALLEDEAAGAVVLGWSQQLSAMFWAVSGENPVVPERSWHERTVGTYAREALKVMTGHRFDGKDPAGVTFAEWWRTHDHGKSALWYWQQRLTREDRALPMLEPATVETDNAFWVRRETASRAYRAALHKATVAEIRRLPVDVQWKVLLLTRDDTFGVEVTGPVNPFFPEGMKITLLPSRLKELIAGANLWPEMADVLNGRDLMLARLARSAGQITGGYGSPMPYKQALAKALETEAPGERWRPVLVSRLKLPAPSGRLNDPEFREGYLRKALADENEDYSRETIAAEMVRGNLKAQWPVLEQAFYSEKQFGGSDARIGILKALGEPPQTEEKTKRLADLIGDPRNEGLLTLQDHSARADLYRLYAMRSLNSIAGKEYVSSAILEDLGIPGRSAAALAELRRLAGALSRSHQR